MPNPRPGCIKKNKTLEEVLQQINRRYVRIKRKDRANNNSILYSVLEELLKIMRKCNGLFESMKPRLEYLGSYFDGLRVGQPTEYDLNVILTVPINYDKITLDAKDVKNGYTTIIMPEEFRRLSRNPNTGSKGFKDTEFWCDNSYRMSVKSFRSWMQGVVDTALNTLPTENGKPFLKIKGKKYKIVFTTSGPANTITIHIDNDEVIDIDLVPTLEFKMPKIPSDTKIDFHKVETTNVNYYFAVPKPSDNDLYWRLAFPYQERYYTDNKNNLKSALKLLKLFRDVQCFNKLASYFIKTLFLWEIIENESKDDFWKNNSLTHLVLYMLIKLRDCLADGNIRNFWCAEHNLLEKLKLETCKNWSNRVDNIINSIQHNKLYNPQIVLKYFTKQSTTQKNKNIVLKSNTDINTNPSLNNTIMQK